MGDIKVVLDGSSATWMAVFKNSPEIRAGLNTALSAAAARNTDALQQSGVKGLQQDHKFVAVIDIADKTMIGKVAPANGAKASARRADLPKW